MYVKKAYDSEPDGWPADWINLGEVMVKMMKMLVFTKSEHHSASNNKVEISVASFSVSIS